MEGSEHTNLAVHDRNGNVVETDIVFEEQIGKGAFGKVFKVRMKSGDKGPEDIYCLKMCPVLNGRLTEIDILLKLDSPFILHMMYYKVLTSPHRIVMITELMEDDLYKVEHRTTMKGESLGIYVPLYAFQLFRGLCNLASHGIMHRDLKPENLLVQHGRGILKIGDFGLAADMSKRSKFGPYVGTRAFRAPEQLIGTDTYGSEIDIWAAGVVLTEMVLFEPIFSNHGGHVMWKRMVSILGWPTEADLNSWKLHLDTKAKYLELKEDQQQLQRTDTLQSLFQKLMTAGQSTVKYVEDRRNLHDLLHQIFVYNTNNRIKGWDAVAHPYFDRLWQRNVRLPNGNHLPDHLLKFDWTEFGQMTERAKRKFNPIFP